jgi:hypothetical protein
MNDEFRREANKKPSSMFDEGRHRRFTWSDPQGVPLIFQFFADGIGTLPILDCQFWILV